MAITHTKVSGIADGADATLVLPSDWNASHTIAAPGIETALAPSTDAVIAANTCFFVDEEFVVADGMELLINDGASMVIV